MGITPMTSIDASGSAPGASSSEAPMAPCDRRSHGCARGPHLHRFRCAPCRMSREWARALRQPRSRDLQSEPGPPRRGPLRRSGRHDGSTFRAELLKAPPCLILTWPAVEISNGAGTVLASGPGDATASPPLTLLVTSLEFHLGWASWCGPYPDGPFDALVGLPGDASVSLALPAGFGPSSCMGAPTIVYVEPGW